MNSLIIFAAIYGTLTGGELVRAPYIVKCDGANRVTASITEPQANALGYKLVIDELPPVASNEYAVATGYALDVTTSRIVRTYAIRPLPAAVPRYSVADLTFWAATHGKTDALMAWLKSAGYYEVYLTTADFAADNDVFAVARAAILAAGIVTEEELTEALNYARID